MGEPTPISDSQNRFAYRTALTPRGDNSYVTYVPQQILAIKGAPVENGQVEWEIDQDTGDVIARFTERDSA